MVDNTSMPSIDFIRRRVSDTTLRVVRELELKVKPKKTITKLLYFPAISKMEDLTDILNRANWYFPEKGVFTAEVTIPVQAELFDSVKDFSKLKAPEYMGNYITKNKRIRFLRVAEKKSLDEETSKHDALLLWDFNRFFDIPMGLFNLDKLYIVDPNYFLVIEARNYARLVRDTTPKHVMDELEKMAKDNFLRMVKESSKYKKAYAFGTGPSITKALDFDFSDGFRIVANTVISDKRISNHIKPHALVFGDFVYHIGPSAYASQFMVQMKEALESGMYGVIRTDILPFMVSRFPEFKKKLVSIPVINFAPPNIPDEEKYFVKLSNNSLVTYMIPICSAIADQIYMLGCDGRDPKDKGFWSHAKTTHFDDKLAALRQTHPSVFRDTDFVDFYMANARNTEEIISHGENKGKKYRTLAPSFFPALAKRLFDPKTD